MSAWRLPDTIILTITTEVAEHEGSGGRVVEPRTINRGNGGSIPPTSISKVRQFRSPHICLCLSEETLVTGV